MSKRNTIQKQLVLNSVNELFNHPTADDVYRQITLSYPGISKATVYRNLNNLVEDGILVKLNVPGAADKYDVKVHFHHHAICNSCNKIFDLKLDKPPKIDMSVLDVNDFLIEEYVILFKGVCKKCKSKNM